MYFSLPLLSSLCLAFIGMWKKYLGIVLVIFCCITKLSFKQTQYLSYWWSEIHEQISWMALAQSLLGSYSQAAGWVALNWRLNHSQRISFEESSLQDCGWESSILLWLLAKGHSSSLHELLHRVVWVSSWQLASPRANNPRNRTTKREAATSLWLNIRSGITLLLPYAIGHTDLVYRGKRLYKAVNTRR